ncbi:MAG: DNA-directed RNA polymerase [Candidatus Ranarchaeia archaeon]
MFKLIMMKGLVRIPPTRFGEKCEDVALDILKEDYEGLTKKDIGIIIAIIEVNEIGIGTLVPGDGAAFHNVTFTALTYMPELQEITEGEVVEVVDFGAFIRLGALDGLCHVSQITDDFISYDPKRAVLTGKDSGRILHEGDLVRGRIIAVSITGRSRSGKLGLTMRQPFLGKIEWIEEDIQRKYHPERFKQKKKKRK